MDTPLKSLARFIGSFLPVIYCFYLAYYFINRSGSLKDAENNGLGPTVWGLVIVGLLFCIPLIVKLVLIFIELRRPRLRVTAGGPPDARAVLRQAQDEPSLVMAHRSVGHPVEAALDSL